MLAWERSCKLQTRGFVSVQARRLGLTPEVFRGLRRVGCPEAVAVRVLDAVMGGDLTTLSREHKERLRELLAVDAGPKAP